MQDPNSNQPQFPSPPPQPTQPILPAGWERALDQSSGTYYYANRSTGETSWNPPLPPPPPPPPRFSIPPPPATQPPVAAPAPLHGMTQQPNFVANQQHQHNFHIHQMQQPPPNFNPAFPPPNIPGIQNSMPIGHTPQFPPPQMVPPQPNIMQPDQQTAPTTGKVGYRFDASSATTPGLLVPSVRSMINSEMTKNPPPKLELEGLTAGAIADLCNITTEFRAKTTNIDKGDFAETQTQEASVVVEEDVNQYYLPLEPFALPSASRPPMIEAGRVDIRLHALYGKLNRI